MSTSAQVQSQPTRHRGKADTARRFTALLDELKTARRERDELKQARADVDAAVRKQVAEERFERQCEVFRKVYTDFDQVLSGSLVPEFLLPELLQLDNAPDLCYLVGKNPGLCREFADMRPEAAIKKLRAIAHFVEQKTIEQLAQIRRNS